MLEIEIKGLPETLNATEQLLTRQYVRRGLERAYPSLRNTLRERYDQIAATVPYSPASYGRRKRSGTIIPDGEFGKDTGALYNDLQTLHEIDADSLTIYSDRDYAEKFNILLETKKGVEGGLLGIDDTALEPVEVAIGDEAERVWS